MSCGDPRVSTPYGTIVATCDGANYISLPWPHPVNVGDTIVTGNMAYVVTTANTGGTMASTPYHGYPNISTGAVGYSGPIGGSQLSVYGPGGGTQWNNPSKNVDISQYLPDREAHEFLLKIIKDHCSEGDSKELLMMLFDKLSTTEKENIKISPEVVTSLLAFCIEKYA